MALFSGFGGGTAHLRAILTAEDRASAVLRKFANNADTTSGRLLGIARRATFALGAATAALTAFGLKTAADLESSRQGFITLLGSAEKADKTMQRIKDEAKRTPFEIPGLTKATQLLTAVTHDGDRALDFILDIGEGLAAMGRGQAELDRMAVNIQQIAATGRAFGIDIRQFAFAGIPIYEMLREEIGLTGEALDDFIKDGGVTFKLLEKMFKKSTDAGGRWHNAFKNQAGTFNQLLSNMKDSVAIFASDFVKKTGIFDFAKRSIKGVTETFNGLTEAIAEDNRIIQRSQDIYRDFIHRTTGLVLITDARTQAQKRAKEAQKAVTDAQKEFVASQGSVISAQDAVKAAQERLNAALTKYGGDSKQAKDATENLRAKQADLSLRLGNNRNLTDALARKKLELRDANLKLKDATNDMANAQKNFGKHAKDAITVLDSQGKKIQFLIKQTPIYLGELQQAIDKGGLILDQPPAGLGAILAPAGPNKTRRRRRASGGPVTSGIPYIVGEQGEELFIPSQSGKIVPNNKLNTTKNTIANNVNVSVNIGVYAGSQMEKRKLATELWKALEEVAGSKSMTPAKMLGM